MNREQNKQLKRKFRKNRVRAKIFGTADRPRLSVFRSNLHIYAQIIDDTKGITLVSVHSREIKNEIKKEKGGKTAIAFAVGELIAKKAVKANITTVVFDRNGYKYHGRVKAVAEGARAGGLKI